MFKVRFNPKPCILTVAQAKTDVRARTKCFSYAQQYKPENSSALASSGEENTRRRTQAHRVVLTNAFSCDARNLANVSNHVYPTIYMIAAHTPMHLPQLQRKTSHLTSE